MRGMIPRYRITEVYKKEEKGFCSIHDCKTTGDLLYTIETKKNLEQRTYRYCEVHAKRFAEKHDIELPEFIPEEIKEKAKEIKSKMKYQEKIDTPEKHQERFIEPKGYIEKLKKPVDKETKQMVKVKMEILVKDMNLSAFYKTIDDLKQLLETEEIILLNATPISFDTIKKEKDNA